MKTKYKIHLKNGESITIETTGVPCWTYDSIIKAEILMFGSESQFKAADIIGYSKVME